MHPATLPVLIPLPESSPVETQTPQSLSSSSPRKIAMARKIEELKAENKMLKKEIDALNTAPKELNVDFNLLCDKFLPSDLRDFVKAQIRNMNRTAKGQRFSNEFKKFSLSLYFLGPKAYRHLQKSFSLPSVRSLQKFTENAHFTAGFNKHLFDLLTLKIDHMEAEDRICALTIDEISLKSNLFYNFGCDCVIGFEDDGTNRTNNIANNAFVIMARGLKNNWKQPLGYAFTSTTASVLQIKAMLEIF